MIPLTTFSNVLKELIVLNKLVMSEVVVMYEEGVDGGEEVASQEDTVVNEERSHPCILNDIHLETAMTIYAMTVPSCARLLNASAGKATEIVRAWRSHQRKPKNFDVAKQYLQDLVQHLDCTVTDTAVCYFASLSVDGLFHTS